MILDSKWTYSSINFFYFKNKHKSLDARAIFAKGGHITFGYLIFAYSAILTSS